MEIILSNISNIIWGPPLLVLLVGTGIYLTFRLGVLQIYRLPLALKLLFRKSDKSEEGDVTSFAALCTALAATIGTGNIVGVATAIKAGGPGALFWMWMAAFFGMATKYAEGLLAVKYRVVDGNGNMSGGPMYYLQNGLKYKTLGKVLAKMFALFGIVVASIGIGLVPQVNAISQAVNSSLGIPVIIIAVVLTGLVALVTLGGINSISKVAEAVVPFMAVFYVIGALIILVINWSIVPDAVSLVISSAFTKSAAAGGFAGATIQMAIRNGIARGVFSNESGLGSAPIAAAAAKTKSCVEQGLVSMTGTFFDTIIICTMTGLVLIITGEWSGSFEGVDMTNAAFVGGLGNIGEFIVTLGIIFFAFTTILGWNYYGERCMVYLAGIKGIKPFKFFCIIMVAIGGFLKLNTVFIIADIFNGLMAFPNLLGIILLSPVIVLETKSYFLNTKINKTSETEAKSVME